MKTIYEICTFIKRKTKILLGAPTMVAHPGPGTSLPHLSPLHFGLATPMIAIRIVPQLIFYAYQQKTRCILTVRRVDYILL